MSGYVVVDASVACKWLVEEEHSAKAETLARHWVEAGLHLAAPQLMPYEVSNALHRRVGRGEIAVDVATGLLENLMTIGIAFHRGPGLHRSAIELAGRYRRGAAYDAHYLALAEDLDCELWTADRRFYEAVKDCDPRLRLLREFVARD